MTLSTVRKLLLVGIGWECGTALAYADHGAPRMAVGYAAVALSLALAYLVTGRQR